MSDFVTVSRRPGDTDAVHDARREWARTRYSVEGWRVTGAVSLQCVTHGTVGIFDPLTELFEVWKAAQAHEDGEHG